MKYFVYLLINYNKKRILTYAGYTKNIKKRLKLHNSSKGAKFTKGRKWAIIYKKGYSTKSEAMRKEYSLKINRKLRKNLKNKMFIILVELKIGLLMELILILLLYLQ